MRVVSIRELKARLSAYLREVSRGEEFLVTDRGRVVARLGAVAPSAGVGALPEATGPMPRLVALGARPPVRGPRPTDYRRSGAGAGLSPAVIDALLDWVREERR
jgi:prevent-host-death family protein